ncbi:MAG TPA: alpha-hydroxy acid oxidase [Streptosporangiaceae bacterium]
MRLDQLRDRAAARLPAPVSEYFNQGAGPGLSTAEAVAAWDRIRFRPRVLRDVRRVSTSVTVLGQEFATPVLVAPTAMQRAAHPDGELATARGVAASGSLLVLSSNSGSWFTDIAGVGAPWWLQLYVRRDRGVTKAFVQRALDAGATAIVLTVDTPVVGNKYTADLSIYELSPAEYHLINIDQGELPDEALWQADDLTPDDIGWLREISGLPVVVKGVLRADDARVAIEAGAAAVQVSNHGGRQLDLSVATAEALPDIAEAVAGLGAEVYVDGGIRRGEHVLAALALGAKAVFLGRPVLWALTAGGESGEGGPDGVAHLLDAMTEEFVHAMQLAGARDVSEITPDLISPRR